MIQNDDDGGISEILRQWRDLSKYSFNRYPLSGYCTRLVACGWSDLIMLVDCRCWSSQLLNLSFLSNRSKSWFENSKLQNKKSERDNNVIFLFISHLYDIFIGVHTKIHNNLHKCTNKISCTSYQIIPKLWMLIEWYSWCRCHLFHSLVCNTIAFFNCEGCYMGCCSFYKSF